MAWGKVIRVGEVEWHDLKRQITIPATGECPHKRLRYSEHGEFIDCLDCSKQVSAVWALRMYFTQHQMEAERLEAIRAELDKDLKTAIIHRAALAVQNAWRRLKFVPTCPHCYKPISPPDGFGKSLTRSGSGALPLVMKSNLTLVESEIPGVAGESCC
jgi:hypothetical protein